MKRHIDWHVKDFICEKCGQGLSRQSHLDQHMIDIHSNEKSSFACTSCPNIYKQERNLTNHIKLRHNEDVQGFKCRLCTKSFLYRFSLKQTPQTKTLCQQICPDKHVYEHEANCEN